METFELVFELLVLWRDLGKILEVADALRSALERGSKAKIETFSDRAARVVAWWLERTHGPIII